VKWTTRTLTRMRMFVPRVRASEPPPRHGPMSEPDSEPRRGGAAVLHDYLSGRDDEDLHMVAITVRDS